MVITTSILNEGESSNYGACDTDGAAAAGSWQSKNASILPQVGSQNPQQRSLNALPESPYPEPMKQ